MTRKKRKILKAVLSISDICIGIDDSYDSCSWIYPFTVVSSAFIPLAFPAAHAQMSWQQQTLYILSGGRASRSPLPTRLP